MCNLCRKLKESGTEVNRIILCPDPTQKTLKTSEAEEGSDPVFQGDPRNSFAIRNGLKVVAK